MKIKPLQRQKMSRMQYIENYKILSHTLDKMQPSIRWDVAYQTDTLVFKITFKKKYNEKYKKKNNKIHAYHIGNSGSRATDPRFVVK